MAEEQKTPEDRIMDFKLATTRLQLLSVQRQITALERAQAVLHLQEAGWSLERIAKEVGRSKNAVAKAAKAELTEDDDAVQLLQRATEIQEPTRYFVQHLDMSPEAGPNGANWTRYFDSLEEAIAGADAVYDPKNGMIRQEIVEVLRDGTSVEWRFRGGSSGEWSPPRRTQPVRLAEVYKQEDVR
jgi:predicted transcriptional regulator